MSTAGTTNDRWALKECEFTIKSVLRPGAVHNYTTDDYRKQSKAVLYDGLHICTTYTIYKDVSENNGRMNFMEWTEITLPGLVWLVDDRNTYRRFVHVVAYACQTCTVYLDSTLY